MRFKAIVFMAIFSITANKLRTFLTLLGIVIGIAAVISLMSIGKGTQQSITNQIESLGSDLLFVSPASGGVLTLSDSAAISQGSDNFMVAPQIITGGSASFRSEDVNVSINGVTSSYKEVRNLSIASGYFISPADVLNGTHVAVIGAEIAQDLFGDRDPFGEKIKINGRLFTIIGILEAKGGGARFGSEDQQIFIPITTAYYRLTSNRTTQGDISVNSINIQLIEPGSDIDPAETISNILRIQHKTLEDDFKVTNLQDVIDALEEATATFVVLLGAIASISLFVGGIGIMNIMLVSVTERTREIGIRKALGAKRRDILGQFITEAILISFTGGVIGVSLGVLVAALLNSLSPFGPDFQTVVTTDITILSLVVSAMIGLFFGIYPAERAAKLNPIDALRYE
jgi:putative ABC transport system permease protein